MAKHIRPLASLLLIAGCTAVTLIAGSLYVKSASSKFTALEQGTAEVAASDQPADAVRSFLQQIASQDYANLYANAQHTDPSMDSESAYDAALASHFSGIDMSSVLYKPADVSGDIKTYSLSSGTTALGIVKVYNDGSAWQVSMPLTGTKSYLVEVPTGTQLMSNGTAVSADRMVQSAVSASGFDGVYNTSLIPSVDIYQLDGLLGIPSLTDGSGTPYSLVEDVLTGNLIAGTAVQDDAVLNLIIADGETLASYPAKDIGIGAVTAIADTSTLWYQRYVTLQNNWFSDHEASSFSNAQVLDACQQSDSTMTAHVVFDYYAKNTAESLERTWHIGYQLTFEKANDTWIICSTAIDNELNPGTVPAE